MHKRCCRFFSELDDWLTGSLSMQYARSRVFAGVLSLTLTAPVLAQGRFPAPYVNRNPFQFQPALRGFQSPAFQISPFQQQLISRGQLAYGQAVSAQFGFGGAFGGSAVLTTPTGLSTLGAAASLSSSPLGDRFSSLPSYYGASGGSYSGGSLQSPYSQSYSPEEPLGAYLRGTATLTSSYGQYIQNEQKSRLLNQEVERSRIRTRRQLIEEMRTMQSLQPMSEDIRRRDWEIDLSRARTQASVGDVLSGKSLNVLLTQLKQLHAKGQRGPSMPIDAETLAQINVSPKYGRNMGIIKSGKIHWPIGLNDERFTKFRETIDLKLAEAIERARTSGRVDAVLLKDLDTALKGMERTLEQVSAQLSLSQWMETNRYLVHLADGFRALEAPDVQNFFNRKYEARGKTVSDLIDYMIREGLVFVDAAPGAEGAYRSLHNSLAAYENAPGNTTTISPR
jgi:hypothetical protein